MPLRHSGPIRFVGGSYHNEHLDLDAWHSQIWLPHKEDERGSLQFWEATSFPEVPPPEAYELRKLWFKSDGPHTDRTVYFEYHLRGSKYDHAFNLSMADVDRAHKALRSAFNAMIVQAMKSFPPKRRVGFFIPD